MFINNCQIKDLLADEQLTSDMYSQIQNIINTYIQKGIYLDQYGITKQSSEIFEYGNKLIYLVLYLSIINQRITGDIQNCSLQTLSNYRDLYKLDCIKESFLCFSIPINVEALYKVFGLSEPFGFSGINFMAIGLDSPNVCNDAQIFTVY